MMNDDMLTGVALHMHGDNTIGTFCGHIGEDGPWSSFCGIVLS